MSRTHRGVPRVFAFVVCLTVCLCTPVLAQRADRAAISGVVTDDQSSAVPGASVITRNDATGVETVLTTNAAGA